MSIASIGAEQIHQLAPNSHTAYRTAFASADTDLAGHLRSDGTRLTFGANATPLRLAHFLAQVMHETDGLTIRIESMNYSAKRLVEIFPKHFTPAEAERFAHRGEAIAERAYGGRMGNGPEGSGDGWRFIGRGLLQITGREAYERYGRALEIDLAGQPDLAFSAEWSLKIAAAEWAASRYKAHDCNGWTDLDDIVGVTRAVNGGTIGLPSRREWLARAKHVLGL